MTDETSEAELLQILEELDNPSQFWQPGSAQTTSDLERGFRETLALLASASEPMAVSDRLRKSLSRALAEASTGTPERRWERRRWTRSSLAGATPWVRNLAAGLALATLGLAAASGWLGAELRRDRRELAELRQSRSVAAATGEELATTRGELEALRRQLGLVSFGAEVCPLRPPADGGILPDARGVLFIAANRAGWLLTAEGLAAERPGQVFRLWFRRAGSPRPVPGRTFTAPAQRSLEVSSEGMPEDANAVFVTLEDDEGAAEPRGPIVLYGDDAMRIL